MAVLAKVSTLREQLPSVVVDLHISLYYCCTAHQALAALRSLCTEGLCKNRLIDGRACSEFIWTAATLLCAQLRTCFFVTCTVPVDTAVVEMMGGVQFWFRSRSLDVVGSLLVLLFRAAEVLLLVVCIYMYVITKNNYMRVILMCVCTYMYMYIRMYMYIILLLILI